jgi:hypothetical protein
MVEPILPDRDIHRTDRLGQSARGDVKVAEGGGHVADLVAPGVGQVEGQIAARQRARPVGDLAERFCDRPAQREGERRDRHEYGQRHS